MFFHFIKIKDLSKNDFKSYKLLKKLNTKSEIVIVDDGVLKDLDIMQKKFLKKLKRKYNFSQEKLGLWGGYKDRVKKL